MHPEDQEPKKRRSRKKPVDALPVPGTDASEPPDLLGVDVDVDEEVFEATEILNGVKKPSIPASPSLSQPDSEQKNGEDSTEANDNQEFLDNLMKFAEDANYPAELQDVLHRIGVTATTHAEAAMKAGHRSIAGDFNALLTVAKQLAKKTAGVQYWKAR
ncbi:MAG: hypothetical protein K2W95_00890 [Candidatus Obscuribacterales bacterium]|nr:hypothetical protein [Candidatus Obscuribacterales bacterium]